MHVVQHFFSSSMLPNAWNRTYITLIFKKENMSHPNDFWPISLCNSIYKLVAKILIKKGYNIFYLSSFSMNKGHLFKTGV